MANPAHSYGVLDWTRPDRVACLMELPNEILTPIIDHLLAIGRECDAFALARTNRQMHQNLNDEIYRRVIKQNTYYIVHWAAHRGRTETLKKALANGADPNQMWTSINPIPRVPSTFRPVGWGLQTAEKIDLAVWQQSLDVGATYGQPLGFRRWKDALFSSVGLSIANGAHVGRLRNYYRGYAGKVNTGGQTDAWRSYYGFGTDMEEARDEAMDDTRLHNLSKPLSDPFVFPEKMSPKDMERKDVKRAFLQLFRHWNSPLHAAALHDRPEVTEALLANGADLDSTSVEVCDCVNKISSNVPGSPTGNHLVVYTPLHVAICSGSYATARVLMAHGAQKMAKIFTGDDDRHWLPENPLHITLSSRRVQSDYDFIEFLLRHGYAAQIEERNNENLTPLFLACDRMDDPLRDDVVRLLLHYGANSEAKGPYTDRIRRIVTVPVPLGDIEMTTPALWAARKGQFRLAKLLLDHGADPNAKSSDGGLTMLHAVCSRADYRNDAQERLDLLDCLLAKSTTKSVNAFDATGCTPLTMLIKQYLRNDLPQLSISMMQSKLFSKGADIMAGLNMGKETPFEAMISDAVDIHKDTFARKEASEIGDKVLATTRAFMINQNLCRPAAFLNRLWDYVETGLENAWGTEPFWRFIPDVGLCILHGLLKAGFSPAEVDRHGDTAMTSFLKHLLNQSALVAYDKYRIGTEGWYIQSIMALLQEYGAALDVRNKEGYNAFDYLHKIEYDEEHPAHDLISQVVGQQVQPGRDEHGNMCFKFHPSKRLFGNLAGDYTIRNIQRNASRWLVCEHWCRHRCGSSGVRDGQCGCARTTFQKFAKCEGNCCKHQESTHLYLIRI